MLSLGTTRGRFVVAQRLRVVTRLIAVGAFADQGVDREPRHVDFVGGAAGGRLCRADLPFDDPILGQRGTVAIKRCRRGIDALAADPCCGLGYHEAGLDIGQRKAYPECSRGPFRCIDRSQRRGQKILRLAEDGRVDCGHVELRELVRSALQQSRIEGFRCERLLPGIPVDGGVDRDDTAWYVRLFLEQARWSAECRQPPRLNQQVVDRVIDTRVECQLGRRRGWTLGRRGRCARRKQGQSNQNAGGQPARHAPRKI